MRTMFSIGKALFLSENKKIRCRKSLDAYTSLVSRVVLWKANIFYFSHSFIFLFREYHSQFPCSVYIFFLAHSESKGKEEDEGAKNEKSLSHGKERKKKFSNSQRFFEVTFACFFRFSLHSLSVVCEHFIDLEQLKLSVAQVVTSFSRSLSIARSLFLPAFFNSCKKNQPRP